MATASSLSWVRAQSWPQKDGKDGKHIDASTPLTFMSRMRSRMS